MAWKKVKLEKICDISSGGTPSRKENFYYNGQIPWLKISDLNVRGKFVYDSEEKITNRGLNAIRDKIFEKGTLMFAMYGSIGKTAFAGVNLSCNQAILGISSKDNNRTNLDYINYWLKSKKKLLSKLANGVAQKNLSATIIKELEIPLPPMEIQIKIAEALDKAQELIDNRKLQLEKYDELIQSTFIDMFGDPVLNTKKWNSKKLGELTEVGSSTRVFTSELVLEGIPFYRGSEIGKLSMGEKITSELYISLDHYNKIKKKYSIPKIGDLLMSSICPDGKIWCVDNDNPFYYKDGRVLWIKRNEEIICSKYLQYFLKIIFRLNYSKIASGTTFSELKIFILKELLIYLPPIELQNKFASIIEAIENEKKLCEESLKQIEENFDSMIDKAFKGELF
ncbi:restriction endonuclease subunit S [Cetobacterium somerae]|uniref:restriction endonuclease subunit S n=1 Tax=Cetobacterium sp. NK01 TaxID=2993530 RepID=UPI002116760F|nr:restriction endonuclease subunit S [Cetobacterium sp. NK01]MCQ8213255.1 restriction endonuclease subunit S [Cetobacterium sp. NK01]